MSTPDRDVSDLVREIIDEARKNVGSGPRFAERLEELGVGSDSGRYSQSAVSNWVSGRTMPPADVLLAAARIAGISLDGRILTAADEATTGAGEWRAAIDELQAQIDTLTAQMIEVSGQLGLPMPAGNETSSESGAARRAAG